MPEGDEGPTVQDIGEMLAAIQDGRGLTEEEIRADERRPAVDLAGLTVVCCSDGKLRTTGVSVFRDDVIGILADAEQCVAAVDEPGERVAFAYADGGELVVVQLCVRRGEADRLCELAMQVRVC